MFLTQRRKGAKALRGQARLALLLLLLALTIFFFAGEKISAANEGDSVVVVFNSAMPESRAVADHYARLRNVPAAQVLGFKLATTETISRQEFRETLEGPLRRELERQGWMKFGDFTVAPGTNRISGTFRMAKESKLRYAVLCYGVPLKIAGDPGVVENVPTNMPPAYRRNEASVEADLALLPRDPASHLLTGPVPSPYYKLTNAAVMHPTNGLLLVARLDGPTPEIAKGLVDKALIAERDGLWGRAYFDTRNITATNDNYKIGDDWIRNAAAIVRHVGYETVIDDKPEVFGPDFPLSHVAIYEGWYDHHASGPFAKAKVEFMPGAFAYHLHSFSASTLRSTTERWAGPLLARGATCTMGSVDEPYLMGTPDIAVFTANWILRGMTFGEAAFTAQALLSWQTTVIGDPLYRPFGQAADKLHARLEKENNPLVEWSMLRAVNQNIGMGDPPAKYFTYLERHPAAHRSAVLQEKLGDLYFAGGKLIDACDTWVGALQLATSTPQRARLILTATKTLPLIGRDAKAWELYQLLLKENPDWQGKLALDEKMLPLAQRLGKTDDAKRLLEEITRLTPPPAPATNVPPAAKPKP
ncbi:MAG: TIGR03790 family protein [Verrucomicrobia bacterium]|nr:TIGR03790 family protein [Verrucomicrobiota bacterium]